MKNYLRKVLGVLNKKEKSRLIFFSFFSLINATLEFLSLSLLIPLVASLLGTSYGNIFLNFNFFKFLENYSTEEKLVIVLVIISSAYFFKNLFIVIFTWISQNILKRIRIRISNSLFEVYIKDELTENLNSHTSAKIRNIQIEVYSFTKNLRELMLLMIEILVIIFLLTFLIILEPIAAVVTLLSLVLMSGLFYSLIKNKTSEWGVKAFNLKAKTIKMFIETLSLFKEIKINDKHNFFSNKFAISQEKLGKVMVLHSFFQVIPRYYIEVFSILSTAIFSFILIYKGLNIKEIVPILIAYIAAGLRLIPSFNRILGSLQLFRYHLPAVDMMFNELSRFKKRTLFSNKENNTHNNFKQDDIHYIFEIKNLSFKYPGSQKFVLEDVNFTVNQAELIGLKGKTGSGKTTLLNLILGLYRPSNGQINFKGSNINKNLKSWYSNIGYVAQEINLMDETIKNNICLGLEDNEIDIEKLKYVVNICKLDNFINSLQDGLNTSVGELGKKISGGQKQRIGIARALYSSPKILILDEATNALDEKTEKEIFENLKEIQKKLKLTIIMISHNSSIDMCDKIYKIDENKIKLIHE
jgi:ATP-binding cassette, subfamily B, bacterial PglK